MTRRYHCPVELTLDVIGGRWKPVILAHLKEGVHRYGELRRRMPGISEKMLTQQLRELESDGLVTRAVFAERRPRVEYSLTAEGASLGPVLQLLYEWGERRAGARGVAFAPLPPETPDSR
ncbi:helix-turn-helix transcriptional regulator [Amycolatopsis acidiphila]|uniref:Helix-turn-helix transcriptional regulator n=1 Tax=Amycolatopsis acidiphila TaxID=715473 RepID=A0A558A7K3_9PSEU|nr:helix-turn-helix domain-containing protein [Amycolatopsis acidiphila]TVT20226.1 helix-turn-helix transcriptional regulator [Amycolatopsis acidiphila]UIJ58225.1 helix-turn-helix transcriptional regulator [Amycolatopsis acidiphila]GHG69311.1 HxlR family transcriptional regulator [Amycolatopsis acidiphila]